MMKVCFWCLVHTYISMHCLLLDESYDIAVKRCLMKLFVFCAQMLLDPMGGIVMTNDGNAILREVIMNTTSELCKNKM